jgi:endoglycosylceramidase
LRGVNVNAFVDYWSGNDFPVTFPLVESDVDLMAAIGWNAVRLLLSWSRLEPHPGEYDEGYLDEIATAVDLFAGRGIYTILDLHQDAWGATLAARPNELCDPPAETALGWDGAPSWATLDRDQPRCIVGGLRETSPAVLAAFGAFWADTPAADGVGIRTRYVRMLAHVATRFADRNAVAGYDLMNEPNAFDDGAQRAMAEMYAEAIAAIRVAEDEAGGFPHLILFEPSVLWSVLGGGAPPDFEHDDDVVYAPHIYTGGFDGGAITASAFRVARDEAALFGGAPVLSGEWGGDPKRASDPDDPYFLDHQRLQDEFQFSATLWTWRESCGDPHKVSDGRDGDLPVPWGEFDVDCTSNTVVALRRDLIEQLTRPLVRAAPGRVDMVRYDPASGMFAIASADADAVAEVVIFYPSGKHPGAEISTTGLRDVEVLSARAGGSYVRARTEGDSWSLRIGQPE